MHTSPNMLKKVKEMVNDYYALAFVPVAELSVEYMETREHWRRPPASAKWKTAQRGMTWGGHWMTAWFRSRYTPSAKLAGQPLFLCANTGGHESVVWVDSEPRAILTASSDTQNLRPFGHTEMLITTSAGRKAVDKEYYGGGDFVIETSGNAPGDRYIQSAELNGQALNKAWMYHRDLVSGGHLKLVLGPEPNTSWAADGIQVQP